MWQVEVGVMEHAALTAPIIVYRYCVMLEPTTHACSVASMIGECMHMYGIDMH
jgi:hypothetical protein